MDIILVVILAILIAFPTVAWLGLARIPSYIRTGNQLPSALDQALRLRQEYLSNFGSRRDAHTFLALIGADTTSVPGPGAEMYIPLSAKIDFAEEEYGDSIESFVVGNLTRPITKAAGKHLSSWWDDVKARFTADSSKPSAQVALEIELRSVFFNYQLLKSQRSSDGFMVVVGVLALIVSIFICFVAYNIISTNF